LTGANALGAGIRTYHGGTFRNSVIWHHPSPRMTLEGTGHSFASCNTEDPVSGPDNITGYPLFADTSAYDFTLTENSPCVDAAILAYLMPAHEVDLAGRTRLVGPYPDIGAYEYGSQSSVAPLSRPGTARGRTGSVATKPSVTLLGRRIPLRFSAPNLTYAPRLGHRRTDVSSP